MRYRQNKKYYNDIKDMIKKIFYQYNFLYGAPRITKVLRSKGYIITKKTVARIMKEMKLVSIYNKSYKVNTPRKKYEKHICFNKDYIKCVPKNICEVWTVDDTAILINGITYHLYTVIDDFSRRVVAYNLSLYYNAHQIIRT
ncbi:MAG: IS3 family transposase, partial [Lachnospiraceae bacterium]|nr:IS3 family transposase [Lachnospiraceae bacterium]